MSDASPHAQARAEVGRQIEHAAAKKSLSLTQLAHVSGVNVKTIHRIARGEGAIWRTKTKVAIEKALDWDDGEIDRRLEEADREARGRPAEHSMMTEHGLLTWSDNDDGTRNYRLSRRIGGAERGFTIDYSPLSPEEAVDDLRRGLKLLEALYSDIT